MEKKKKGKKLEDKFFAFTADNHLTPHIWINRPAIYGDTYCSLQQIVTYCLDNQCPLLLGGDFFDKVRPDSESVVMAKILMDAMRAAALPVYWIDGNHDKADPSWSEVLGVINIHKATVEIAGFNVYGLGYLPLEELEQALSEVPEGTDILVCHQLLDIACPVRIATAHNMKAEWVPDHVPHVLLGDLHISGTWYHPDTGQAFSYPGSTALMKTDESTEKLFNVVHNDKGHVRLEAEPIITRPFYRFEIGTETELDELVSGATVSDLTEKSVIVGDFPEIKEPLIQIKFNAEIPKITDRIRKALAGKGQLILKPFKTRTEDGNELVTTDLTPELILSEFIDKDDNPEAWDFCLKLIEADSAMDVIRENRERYAIT